VSRLLQINTEADCVGALPNAIRFFVVRVHI
jgi:hypothetical protein